MIKVYDRRNVGIANGIGANIIVRVSGQAIPLNDPRISSILVLVRAHDETTYRTTPSLQGIPATVLDAHTISFPLRADFFGQQSTDGFQDTDKIFSLTIYIIYNDNTSEAAEVDTAILFKDMAADQLHPTPNIE
ncbi:MAG: hypothetical protein ABIN54_09045 [candidate division WOR-3 bacterium]